MSHNGTSQPIVTHCAKPRRFQGYQPPLAKYGPLTNPQTRQETRVCAAHEKTPAEYLFILPAPAGHGQAGRARPWSPWRSAGRPARWQGHTAPWSPWRCAGRPGFNPCPARLAISAMDAHQQPKPRVFCLWMPNTLLSAQASTDFLMAYQCVASFQTPGRDTHAQNSSQDMQQKWGKWGNSL